MLLSGSRYWLLPLRYLFCQIASPRTGQYRRSLPAGVSAPRSLLCVCLPICASESLEVDSPEADSLEAEVAAVEREMMLLVCSSPTVVARMGTASLIRCSSEGSTSF